MTICLLSQNFINQIAICEVVKHLTSALKELIENAIDAKSKWLNVYFQKGGKAYFSVTDNGKGMAPDRFNLTIKHYAISKRSIYEHFVKRTLNSGDKNGTFRNR